MYEMLEKQRCPQCFSVGKASRLQTYQINLEEAIVLCENKQCTYPFEKQHKSATATFQRDFSKIARYATLPNDSQKVLQERVAVHMRKNGHSLQKDDVGIQTETSKTRKKQKSLMLWRKQHSLTSLPSSNDVSRCYQQFHPLSNEMNVHEHSVCETKAWSSCYGSDGASDRDSSNSSQDGVESANRGSSCFPSEHGTSSVGRCSLYEGFQFGMEGSDVSYLTHQPNCDLEPQENNIPSQSSMNFLHTSDSVAHTEKDDFVANVPIPEPVKSVAGVQIPESLESMVSVQIPETVESMVSVQIPETVESMVSIKTPETVESTVSIKIPETVESMVSVPGKLISKANMHAVENSNSVQSEHLTYPLKFPQWRNCDALCWLDVILCLAVHNETLKGFVLGEEFDRGNIIYRLVRAHQQACWLINGDKGRTSDPVKPFKYKHDDVDWSKRNKNENQQNIQDIVIAQQDHVLKVIHASQPDHASQPKKASYQIYHASHQLDPASYQDHASHQLDPASHPDHTPHHPDHASHQLDNALHSDHTSQQDHASLLGHTSKTTCTDSITKAENFLNETREEVWGILNRKLKCDKGKPESPVFALPLLLHESSMVESLFKMKYRFVYNCSQCGREETSQHSNCLPTFPAVADDFCITTPQHLKTCSHCGWNKDRRQMTYEKLPECLLMHFTEGLPHTDFMSLQFDHHGNKYTVTGVVQYKKCPDHFVAWLRNPLDNKWMKCDDLKSMICKYKSNPPSFPSEQVHIVMWERLSNEVSSELMVNSSTHIKPLNNAQLSRPSGISTKKQDVNCIYTRLNKSGACRSLKDQTLCSSKQVTDLDKMSGGDERDRLALNICSNGNRCSTLSTESSDSIFLPNFVSSTPVTCTLLKPEPRQFITLPKTPIKKPNKLICKEEDSNGTGDSLSYGCTSSEIKGHRSAIQPSSVFHVPMKSVPCLGYTKDPDCECPCQLSECTLSHKEVVCGDSFLNVNRMDKNKVLCDPQNKNRTSETLISKTSCEKTEKHYRLDNACIVDKGMAIIKTNIDSKSGKDRKSSLKEATNTNFKKNSLIMQREITSATSSEETTLEKVKIDINESTATRNSSLNNLKISSRFLKKSRFKIPVPAVKKTSISKDAFFTLDVGNKKSSTLTVNSTLKSSTMAGSGDISVLNSVKQYLLSKITEKMAPKFKFKGMDLKSSPRASSCAELELSRSGSGSSTSVDTQCSNENMPAMSISSSWDHRSLEGNLHQDKQNVSVMKRKSDVAIQNGKKRKRSENKLFKKGGSPTENMTATNDLNSIQRRVNDAEFCFDPYKDESLSVEIQAGYEQGNSNVVEYEETVHLQNLYEALNIPYNSVNDTLSDITDVNEILDCFKMK